MLLQKFNLGSDVCLDEIAAKCEGMRQVSRLALLNCVYRSFLHVLYQSLWRVYTMLITAKTHVFYYLLSTVIHEHYAEQQK